MKRKWNLDLSLKPVRRVEWVEKEGRVSLKVVKFRSRIGRWFCNTLKKPDYFFINLDEIGGFVWKRCDGKNTLADILQEMKREYGEEMMEERLAVFIYILQKYDYITFVRDKEDEVNEANSLRRAW